MQALAFLLARFSEPSSYAGLGAVLALLGLHFSDTDLGQLAQFLAAACGVAALLLKERGVISMFAAVALLGAALSACAPVPGAGETIGNVDRIVQTADTVIVAACREYAKGRDAANAIVASGVVPAGAAAKVGIIEQYGDAACAHPPAGDALSTATWLGTLVGQIGSLTSAAPAT